LRAGGGDATEREVRIERRQKSARYIFRCDLRIEERTTTITIKIA
jgi:hypothetical protein